MAAVDLFGRSPRHGAQPSGRRHGGGVDDAASVASTYSHASSKLEASLRNELAATDAYRGHVTARLEELAHARGEAAARREREAREAAQLREEIAAARAREAEAARAAADARASEAAAKQRALEAEKRHRTLLEATRRGGPPSPWSSAADSGAGPAMTHQRGEERRVRHALPPQSADDAPGEVEEEVGWQWPTGLRVREGPPSERRGDHGAEAGWGIGKRVLEDRGHRAPLGGEVEAGWGVGNRVLEDRKGHRAPLGGEVEAGWGIGDRTLGDEHAHRPLGGEVEAGWGIDDRVLKDQRARAPRGGEVEAGWGIGNRLLSDSQTPRPRGGEVEAGWGIGNRVLENNHTAKSCVVNPTLSKVEQAEAVLRKKIDLNYSNLRKAFTALDRMNKGHVTLGDFTQAIFRLFLTSGFTKDEVAEVARSFDLNGDGFVSYNEFAAVIERRDLEKAAAHEPIYKSEVEDGASEDEVAHAILEFRRSVEGRFHTLRDAFCSMDREHRSSLNREEFDHALRSHGVTLGPVLAEAVRRQFDVAGTGTVTYNDFCAVMSQRSQFGGLDRRTLPTSQPRCLRPALTESWPEATVDPLKEAENLLRDKIRLNYADTVAAFRALDRSKNGYISQEDFHEAMTHAFFPAGVEGTDLKELARRFDLNGDGFISHNEFIAVIEGGADGRLAGARAAAAVAAAAAEAPHREAERVGEVDLAIQNFKQSVDRRYSSLRDAFVAMDRSRRASLDPLAFREALASHGVKLSPEKAEAVRTRFDPKRTGRVTYTDFSRVMSGAQMFGSHISRQMFSGEPPGDAGDADAGAGRAVAVAEREAADTAEAARRREVEEADTLLREKLAQHSTDPRVAFRSFDGAGRGYVSCADFAKTAQSLLLGGFKQEAIREVAQRFDLNGDGYISSNEFVAVLERRDMAKVAAAEPAHSPDETVDAVDLALQTFRQSVDRRYGNLRDAFVAMDTGRRTWIGLAELEAALRSHGVGPLSQAELEAVFSQLDARGSGRVSYADFNQVMSRRPQFGRHLHRQNFRDASLPSPRPAAPAPAPTSRSPRAASGSFSVHGGPDLAEETLRRKVEAKFPNLRAAFRALDGGLHGGVRLADFTQALSRYFPPNFPREDLMEVAQRFDVDGDGAVSFADFSAAMARSPKSSAG